MLVIFFYNLKNPNLKKSSFFSGEGGGGGAGVGGWGLWRGGGGG